MLLSGTAEVENVDREHWLCPGLSAVSLTKGDVTSAAGSF